MSYCRNSIHSLRSKRFRGVFCTKKPIFLFLDAREMGRERKREGGGEERGRKETLARKPHDFAERPLDTFTLERTLVECLSNTPCGFVVKVRWKQSALGQDLLLFSVCPKYSKPGMAGNFVSFNPDGV